MKRNPILVLGLGVLLSFGVFAVGCGDDAAPKKLDGSADAKKLDAGSTGGAVSTGGTVGTGGAIGTGGAVGTGGVVGTGGSVRLDGGGTGGAVGTGGVIGTGGSAGDGGPRVEVGQDTARAEVSSSEAGRVEVGTPDVPLNNDTNGLDGSSVRLDTNPLDVAVDTSPVSLDTAVLDTAAVDTAEIEAGIDSNID